MAKPYLDFDEIRQINNNEERIPVLLHIEPERLYRGQEFKMDEFEQRVEEWILGGLTAKPELANVLTGSLQISLSPSKQTREQLDYFGKYPVIPSSTSKLVSMTNKVDMILDRLAELPIERTLSEVDNTLIGAQKSFDEVNQTLKEMQKSLQGIQPDSQLYHSIDTSMHELQQTLKSVQPILSEINKRPNTLIFSGPQRTRCRTKRLIAMNKKRISILAVIATGVATLSGCGLNQPAPEMKYHLLDNQKVAMNHQLPETKVAIAKVKLSDYLLQPNLVMRVQDNQLDVANYHSWAEPLDKAVQRILIDNLNQKRSETGFVDRCQNCSQVHVFIDPLLS